MILEPLIYIHVHAKHITTVYNFTVHVKLDGHKLYYFVSWRINLNDLHYYYVLQL